METELHPLGLKSYQHLECICIVFHILGLFPPYFGYNFQRQHGINFYTELWMGTEVLFNSFPPSVIFKIIKPC